MAINKLRFDSTVFFSLFSAQKQIKMENRRQFEIDFDKVSTIEDIKCILKAMQLVLAWQSGETPQQFLEIEGRGFLKEIKQ